MKSLNEYLNTKSQWRPKIPDNTLLTDTVLFLESMGFKQIENPPSEQYIYDYLDAVESILTESDSNMYDVTPMSSNSNEVKNYLIRFFKNEKFIKDTKIFLLYVTDRNAKVCRNPAVATYDRPKRKYIAKELRTSNELWKEANEYFGWNL